MLIKNQGQSTENEYAIATPMEDLFNILREGHLATGHGKELVLYNNISRCYFNVTREIRNMLANDYATCMKIRNYAKNARAGHNPIVTIGFGSREQVDLVDM